MCCWKKGFAVTSVFSEENSAFALLRFALQGKMREAKGKMRRKAEKGKGERERNTELKTELQRRERRGKKAF